MAGDLILAEVKGDFLKAPLELNWTGSVPVNIK